MTAFQETCSYYFEVIELATRIRFNDYVHDIDYMVYKQHIPKYILILLCVTLTLLMQTMIIRRNY